MDRNNTVMSEDIVGDKEIETQLNAFGKSISLLDKKSLDVLRKINAAIHQLQQQQQEGLRMFRQAKIDVSSVSNICNINRSSLYRNELYISYIKNHSNMPSVIDNSDYLSRKIDELKIENEQFKRRDVALLLRQNDIDVLSRRITELEAELKRKNQELKSKAEECIQLKRSNKEQVKVIEFPQKAD